MKMMLLVLFAIVSLSGPAQAFDPKGMAMNIRKTLGLDTRMEINVTSFTVPSGLGNMELVSVTIQGQPYSVFLTPDGKNYIFGGILGDNSIDPDKARERMINMKGVRSQGSGSASVTIVEFSDFQCNHCRAAHEILKNELYKTYTKDQVRLVFKHFPLNGHSWAEPAAVATECAAQQKEAAFWDMADFFFMNQAVLSTDTIKSKSLEAAKSFKLDGAAFNKCLSAGPALEKVQSDKREGLALGVNSTPTIYINGRSRRGFANFDDIKVVVDEKLKNKK